MLRMEESLHRSVSGIWQCDLLTYSFFARLCSEDHRSGCDLKVLFSCCCKANVRIAFADVLVICKQLT